MWLPDDLQIDRVPHANPHRSLIYTRNRLRAKLHSLLQPNCEQLPAASDNWPLEQAKVSSWHRFDTLKDLLLDYLLSFPDPQCFWFRPAVRWLSTLSSHERPDVVFATGSPWTSLLVGKALAHRFNVPFIADFRDPWTRNPYKRPSPFLSRRAMKIERAICVAAARVVTNTPELCKMFLNDYPDLAEKFITITNGFDNECHEQLINPVEADKESQKFASNGDCLELCHFGTVYGNRNPLPLFQAIKDLVEEKSLSKGRLRVRFVGTWEVRDDMSETLARELEAQGIIRREAPIPHDACLRQLASAPFLLILQPASPLQIPAKIYEYIFARRPLLVIGGEGATSNLVRQHRLGTCCANEVSEIKEILRRVIRGQMLSETPRPADRGRFSYNMLTAELASLLDSVCAKRIHRARVTH
jgi:glycosyltransferase involved in cell wall biosynthesis